jgi:hypothetical protein
VAHHDPEGVGATCAVVWFADRVVELGGEPLLVVPARKASLAVPEIACVSSSPVVKTLTKRRFTPSFAWTGGVLLVAWPDRALLARVLADARATAVCVLDDAGLDVAGAVSLTGRPGGDLLVAG